MVVPPTAKRSEAKLPLLVALHGYGGSGASFARFLRLRQQSIKRGFVFIAPDGHSGADGKRFWNASPACCDFDGSGVDHVAELGKLITEAQRSEHVDPTRVVVLGYSNGGFMAHRLACDLPGISAIASIAGAGVTQANACAHAPARILEVHGDVDQVVPFAGGRVLGKTGIPAFPGALETMTAWAKKRGCDAAPSAPTKLDLDPALPGSETAQIGWSCAPGLALWRVEGGTHSLATGSSELDRSKSVV